MQAAAALPVLAPLHAELARVVEGLVRLSMRAPPPWAALFAGAGVVFLLAGARQRHVLALPGGAVLGLVAARLVVAALDGPGGAVQGELLWISAGVGAFVCAAWPPIFPPLALALPGVLVGWLLPVADRPWLGAVVGAAVGGGLGALLREWVACLAAGGLGAAAVIAGTVGLLAKHPIVEELAGRPMFFLAAWTVLAVAGAAFHAGRAWSKPGARRAGEETIHPPDEAARAGADADR